MRTLNLRCGPCSVNVIPDRGSLVSRLTVFGRDVLYLDRATLDASCGSVRGGIPVLFPFAGRLENDRLLPHNTLIPRHGFARTKSWKVVRADHCSATTRLTDDVDTFVQYPYRFTVEQTVTALADGVHIDLAIENSGSTALPLSPGWHPYFAYPERLKARVLREVAREHWNDRKAAAFDLAIPAPGSRRVDVDVDGPLRLTLTFSVEMQTLQLWSEAGKDFICIEPIFGPANTINTDQRASVNPGRRNGYWMRIRCASTDTSEEVLS